jgi:hypothetical protein
MAIKVLDHEGNNCASYNRVQYRHWGGHCNFLHVTPKFCTPPRLPWLNEPPRRKQERSATLNQLRHIRAGFPTNQNLGHAKITRASCSCSLAFLKVGSKNELLEMHLEVDCRSALPQEYFGPRNCCHDSILCTRVRTLFRPGGLWSRSAIAP